MRSSLGTFGVVGFAGVLGALASACGGDAPASRVGVEQGGGGNGGMAGSLFLGGGAGSGGTAGAGGSQSGGASGGSVGGAPGGAGSGNLPRPPDIALHTCPAVADPPCPALALAGDVMARTDAELQALQGVTSIEGQLTLRIAGQVDALSCLETVGDNLDIDVFGADTDVSLWGLRNLKTVGGGVELSAGLERVYPDCGLSRLESLGMQYLTGGAVDTTGDVSGELDLSRLTLVRHIRIRGSLLTRLILPSGVTLNMGQFLLEDDPYLTEVAGFEGVTIDSASVGSTYSVRIVDNPSLSTCRANAIAKLFTDGGSPVESVTIMNNAPCE